MPNERDSQRGRVYQAEHLAFHHGEQAAWTIRECQLYANKVAGSAWFARQWPKAERALRRTGGPWIVHGRNGGRAAYDAVYDEGTSAWRWRISLGIWGRRDWIVLHELAHTITRLEYGSSVAGHGWQWASIYLALVRHHLGAEAGSRLASAFKVERVRYTAPRAKRPITPEQRAELVGRLAAARTRKAEQ